jgi:hypothetical protein
MSGMEPILTDTLRFRMARMIAQRKAYREQRDQLAAAIGEHRARHAAQAHEADKELWSEYMRVMRGEPDLTLRRAGP